MYRLIRREHTLKTSDTEKIERDLTQGSAGGKTSSVSVLGKDFKVKIWHNCYGRAWIMFKLEH